MLEKRWAAIAPRPFTADGGIDGKITIGDTDLFRVKQQVIVSSAGQPNLELEVKRVISRTELFVGPKAGNIESRTDVSLYLISGGAQIWANEQLRSKIPEQEVERITYEEEPVVARRVTLVDKMGKLNDIDNPLHVQLSDGSVNIGTVNAELEVQLTHKDNNSTSRIHDSIRIGDGELEATMTPTADVARVGINTNELNKAFSKPWTKVEVLAKNDDGDPVEIKTSYNGVECQKATLIYDSDGDLESLEVEDL